MKDVSTSFRITIILLIIVSGLYPLTVWALGNLAFPRQANGSLVRDSHGKVIGARLLGQGFTRPEYFHPRPSAAGGGYDSTASGGTNLGPTSDKLINGIHKKLANGKDDPGNFDGIKDLAAAYRVENSLPPTAAVPVDAVTRSASGLDPHISVANAMLQAARVAAARHIGVEQVEQLVAANTQSRGLGFLGEPGVNVLMLNLALDRQWPVSGH